MTKTELDKLVKRRMEIRHERLIYSMSIRDLRVQIEELQKKQARLDEEEGKLIDLITGGA